MIRNKNHHREQSDKVRLAMDETEQFHVRKTDPTFARAILQYRLSRGWKRQDLARFLNEKESVVASLENASAVHDPSLVHKIKRKCGI